mmetsp:Transcript_9380/g.28197  ORF Transcript_9380/g.28197 Transcript_9380/m.28197 type:complete len:660 (-) Transcript_9380:1506-3485(-)
MSMTMVSAAGGADNVFEGGSVHFSSGGGNGLPAHSSQQHLTDVQAQQMGMQPQHNMLPPASPHDLPSGLATPSGNLDDVDKLLQAWQQPGQGSFDLPPDLPMDWTLPVVQEQHQTSAPLTSEAPPPNTSAMMEPQPFAGPVSRLGWATSPTSGAGMSPLTMPASAGMPSGGSGMLPIHSGNFASAVHGMHSFASEDTSPASSQEPEMRRPLLPAIPRASARRASVPAAAHGGLAPFSAPLGGPMAPLIAGSSLWETRSTPPLWPIGENGVVNGPGGHTRSAMSAEADSLPLPGQEMYTRMGVAAGVGVRRLRPSVRSASVGANSDRPLSPSDLEPGGISGVKAKERNRRAQKRFRERQKVKQQEAVQRVVQLEEQLDRLEMERSELSQKLHQMTYSGAAGAGAASGGAGAPKADDSASEQQQSAPPSSERVLTLSVPRGQERHLTSSDIKKLTWEEYICLYENYLEEMAAMLLQAQGNGCSAAGTRLQRLSTELLTVTAAVLMHDPTTKGRLHCMPLMSTPVDTPLAPPDQDFWQRVTLALCLSPAQRVNCQRLRNAHLHKVRDIMQDRFRINAMMQTTLPSFDYEQQAARQHLRALAVSENLQRNLRQEQGLQLELATTFFSQALTPIQMATAATESYPWWPDILAMLTCATEGMEVN